MKLVTYELLLGDIYRAQGVRGHTTTCLCFFNPDPAVSSWTSTAWNTKLSLTSTPPNPGAQRARTGHTRSNATSE